MPNQSTIKSYILKQPKWRFALAILALAVGVYFFKGRSKTGGAATTFTARRGPLDITVLEGGSVQAIESQEAKCEVRIGYQGIKILKIVEEGYLVTEDDIKTNKVLVELDSSELRKQITQQDITFESTAASLVDSQQAYDIQLNQNFSDVKAVELKAKFARMDFEKFLGDDATKEIIAQIGLNEDLTEKPIAEVPKPAAPAVAAQASSPAPSGSEAGSHSDPSGSANGPEIKVASAELPLQVFKQIPGNADPRLEAKSILESKSPAASSLMPPSKSVVIDFAKYADIKILGDGEAKQKIRKFDDDWQVTQKEYNQAKTSLDGTQRLFERGFVTKTELDNEALKLENSRLKVQTADTARSLFLKYEFPKSAEEFTSKYAEAIRELDRARKGAVSKLAQAEAKLKSAQGRYNLELRQRKELNEQVDKCMIKAQKQGLVVYGGGGDENYYYGGQEQIREGATVRERQSIITIPDMTKMSVKVKIHETYIKKIKKTQKVRITVDAFPDKILEGEVSKVGVLPDSQNRWMNPDLKVYLTTITISSVQDWIKPGMSAKVEILVKQLPEVIYIPIQAVISSEEKRLCYVSSGAVQERREVEIGEFNDEFIEIKNGIKEGEKVCLKAPEGSEEKDEAGGELKTGQTRKKPAEGNQEKPVIKPAQAPPKPTTAG